ncbi:MAG: NACHT domain-containing protein [Cyanobacteria bacterium CRU_2_1]|nr:NACHT domain-containing protein [Hydrococcus sp. RU_2_2]NJR58142.1 NACHT domain-containing protein [Cyanobacteria bacterium CRU_2_1]
MRTLYASERLHGDSIAPKVPPKPKRNRGVILTPHGWDKLQVAKSQAEFHENEGNRFTLEELSDRTGLAIHTTAKALGRSEPVDKQSLQYVFRAFGLELSQNDYTRPNSLLEALESRQENPRQDWGEAVDTSVFYGRGKELIQLRGWILEEHCRLITVLGIGGIGKSTLAVTLALQIQSTFDVVVWRSLQNAPPIEEWLEGVLTFLLRTQGENSVLPTSLSGKLSKLMECLRTSRCLLILDNVETILCSGERTGQYREGYEEYGQLLRYIGEVPHQSCLLLTSREKTREIALLEGETAPVRSLLLSGLDPDEGRELFQQKGQFTGSDAQWHRLIVHYGGNPLALKLVAAATQELFNGKIADVLNSIDRGVFLFEDIRDLLDRQFDRLSAVEQEVIIWLAINREPVSLSDLSDDIITLPSRRKLPAAMNSLLKRSLVEKRRDQFSLQPVVMEYVTNRLIKQVCEEILAWGSANNNVTPLPSSM